MAWTTPKTWSSEPLTSDDLNTYVRDNQNHIYNRLANNEQYQANESSDYTTTSSTFVDVDATEGKFQHTITTNGGNVLVGFAGVVTVSSNVELVGIDIDVDGSRFAGDDGIMVVEIGTSIQETNVSFVVLVTGLSAGSHTFKLQWKHPTGNTATLYAGAGTSNFDVHPQFWVQEL